MGLWLRDGGPTREDSHDHAELELLRALGLLLARTVPVAGICLAQLLVGMFSATSTPRGSTS